MTARNWQLALLPVPFLALGAVGVGVGVGEDEREDLELEEAEVFAEFNSTDGDFGIQFFWDGEPWHKMQVTDAEGETVILLKIGHSLAEQGLTEGFFESAEPPPEVLSMAQFFERFPEGEYGFEGQTLDGLEIEGETEFTHVMPSPPANLSPAEGDRVSADEPLILSFDAVTTDLDGEPLEPERYEIVLESEGETPRHFTAVLEGDNAHPAVAVPSRYLVPGTDYKLEVICQEGSGNRTITETSFATL